MIKSKRKSRSFRGRRPDGYMSGLEAKVAEALDNNNIKFEYESPACVFPYLKPIRSASCISCNSTKVSQSCKYTADFWLPDLGFYIESKGRFTGSDRRKHKLLKDQYDNVTIKFLFEYDGWLTKKHKSTYTVWATSHELESAIWDKKELWMKRLKII